METKTHELRAFTKEDYYGFAGVNSATPFICDSNNDGIVILDDRTVQFITYTDEVGDGCRSEEYETEEQARLVAEAICGSKNMAKLAETLLEQLL